MQKTTNIINTDQIFAFGKYLFWSELSRKNFILTSSKIKDDSNFKVLFSISQWYASFYVVIEGWNDMKIEIESIKYLLNNYPDKISKLRKFRNAVYHYQPDIFDDRFKDGLRDDDLMFWISCLGCEFRNFLWNYPKYITKDESQIKEINKLLFKTLNWRPKDIIPARVDQINELVVKALKMLKASNDYTSPAAKEVLKAIHQTVIDLKDVPLNPLFSKIKKPFPQGH